MTSPARAYTDARDRLWALMGERQRAALRARYPETGGVASLAHNWYRCSRDPEVRAEADALFRSFEQRWARVRARLDREFARNLTHQNA